MARRGGWRRVGRKRFRYVDARGRRITGKEHLERIRALTIPPAWTDVWISPNPRARLQATGMDRAGRKQYIYHPTYRAARERQKFERLLEFAIALPGLRSQTAKDVRLGPYEHGWACALAVGLINRTWFRVGSDRHARRSRTFGVTTLRKRHVSVEKDVIRFRFQAKNGRPIRRSLRDRTLARGVAHLLQLPHGSRLFRFERDGELADLTSPALNAYLADGLGDGFTAKDFRTWGGTLLTAVELERRGPPADEMEAKRVLAAVMRTVGDELGNTAAVARDSYVSPRVVDAYKQGQTLADFRAGASTRPARLTADERALLRLLRAAELTAGGGPAVRSSSRRGRSG
jgi:DNA topoisomerase-1